MYARQFTSEETYTLLEAEKILKEQRVRRIKAKLAKVKYKLLGAFCLAFGIVGTLWIQDIALLLIMILCSIYYFSQPNRK